MTKSIIERLSEEIDKSDLELTCKEVRAVSDGFKVAAFVINKTSRSVIKRFNEVLGLNWEDEYERDGKILRCKLSVFDKDNDRWITRIGVGTPSKFEPEKGEYSDALKRASVQFGHGTELYLLPKIRIKMNVNEVQEMPKKPGHWQLKYTVNLKEWSFDYKVEDGKPIGLQIFDEKGVKRWGD